MKILMAILFVFVCTQVISQDVYTKDGVLIGNKDELMKPCIEGGQDALLELNGVKIDIEEYCSCLMVNVMSNLTASELKKHTEDGDLLEILTQGENLKLLMDCALPNVEYEDDFTFDQGDSTKQDLYKSGGVDFCTKQVLEHAQLKLILNESEAKEYCTCAMDNLFSSGYTFGDVNSMDRNSPEYADLIMSCMSPEMLRTLNMLPPPIVEDISQEDLPPPIVTYITEEVALNRSENNDYSVKLETNGMSRYFTIDPRAINVVINNELEAEYLRTGSISSGHYIGSKTIDLADGSKLECKLLLMPSFNIGGFTVYNIETLVVPDGELLLGKSLLDKFLSWHLSEEKRALILKKEQ